MKSTTNTPKQNYQQKTRPVMPIVEKKKPSFILMIALIFISLSSLITTTFFAYQYRQLKKNQQEVTPPPISAPTENKPSEDKNENEWMTYTSKEYGFYFKYPQEYAIQEGTYGNGQINPNFLLIKKKENPETIIQVNISQDIRDTLLDTSQWSFHDFALDRVKNSCAADSPRQSNYCDEVIEEKTYSNQNNLNGYVFYLNLVKETFGDKPSKENSKKGPIYVIDISQQTNARMISFDLPEEKTAVDEEILLKIVSTLEFTYSPEEEVVAVAKRYLNAYLNGNWALAKNLCHDDQFDETAAAGYNFESYQIITTEADTNPNYYHIYINLTDKEGKVYTKTPYEDKPLQVLMIKDDFGNWKALTWYFFP